MAAAQKILAARIKHGDALGSPGALRDYLRLLLHDCEHEVFVVVLLDSQNRVIAAEELFRGTLTQTSVYRVFLKYKDTIARFSPNELHKDAPSRPELRLDTHSDKTTVTYYAPVDYVNHRASLAFIGITPGREQMNNALRAACRAIRSGVSDDEVMRLVKRKPAFSGRMRTNLVKVLDHYGFHRRHGLRTCAELWESADHLAHFTSVLKWPVFTLTNGVELNYTGRNPDLSKYEGFRTRVGELTEQLEAVPGALIPPSGGQGGRSRSRTGHRWGDRLVPRVAR